MFIVTARAGDERLGCLIGFATQTSIDPPRFAVGLSRKNRTHRRGRDSPALAVHCVRADAPRPGRALRRRDRRRGSGVRGLRVARRTRRPADPRSLRALVRGARPPSPRRRRSRALPARPRRGERRARGGLHLPPGEADRARSSPLSASTTRAKPPKSASDSARWPARWRASAARACSSVTPASSSGVGPVAIPAVEGLRIDLGVELHAPRAADPEGLGAVGGPRSSSTAPGGNSTPSSLKCRPAAPSGRAPSKGSSCAAGSASAGPRPPAAAAGGARGHQRVGEELAAKARRARGCRARPLAQERRLGGEAWLAIDVEHRLLPPSDRIPSTSESSGSGSPRRTSRSSSTTPPSRTAPACPLNGRSRWCTTATTGALTRRRA